MKLPELFNPVQSALKEAGDDWEGEWEPEQQIEYKDYVVKPVDAWPVWPITSGIFDRTFGENKWSISATAGIFGSRPLMGNSNRVVVKVRADVKPNFKELVRDRILKPVFME